jgi:phosphoketolase
MTSEHGTASAARPLSPALDLIEAWWRAANYLSVGQIYLLDNPLLERPLERSDIKRGCWAIGERSGAGRSWQAFSFQHTIIKREP